ncbi:MAG: hypothetical protein M3Z01_02480 [Thermoproteota archaeon]|nr:hypothetical protein [Thermoproteota archaeon]
MTNNNFARAFKSITVPESFLINTDDQIVYRTGGSRNGNTTNIENFITFHSSTLSAHIISIIQGQNSTYFTIWNTSTKQKQNDAIITLTISFIK